jgi:hypothetical protein
VGVRERKAMVASDKQMHHTSTQHPVSHSRVHTLNACKRLACNRKGSWQPSTQAMYIHNKHSEIDAVARQHKHTCKQARHSQTRMPITWLQFAWKSG